MLRGDEKYLGEIAKRIDEFQAQMGQFSMADDVQTTLMGLWKTYYDGVKALIEADRGMKTTAVELQEAARQLQEKAIAAAAAQEIVAAEQTVLHKLTWTQTFGLAISSPAARPSGRLAHPREGQPVVAEDAPVAMPCAPVCQDL